MDAFIEQVVHDFISSFGIEEVNKLIVDGGVIISIVTSIVFIIKNIILYFRAYEYSRYYGIPIDLFDRISIMNIIKYLMIIVTLIFYVFLPFIINYFLSNYDILIRLYTTLFSITFIYFYVLLLVIKIKKLSDSFKWILSFVASIIITLIFALLIYYQCKYTKTIFDIYIVIMFLILLFSIFKIIIINSDTGPRKQLTFEIFNGADLEINNKEINDSMFAIVYYNMKNIIACKCEITNNKKLIIYKKYIILENNNYFKNIITFNKVDVKEPDIKSM